MRFPDLLAMVLQIKQDLAQMKSTVDVLNGQISSIEADLRKVVDRKVKP